MAITQLLWDEPGDTWDSGLTWDAGDSPNPGNVAPYLDLVTSEHNLKPDFMAMLEQVFQPLADNKAVCDAMTVLFDIDTAKGLQLDAIGLWVGRSRRLKVPITGVYFTFNTGPGFNQGIFRGPYSPADSLIDLPDASYRTLLKATIAANHWDGTVVGATEAYAIVFGPAGYQMLIVDHQNMTMEVILGGPVPDAVTLALLLGGYLNLKPSGVRVTNYIVSANSTKKIFAFNAPPLSPVVGGFNVAAFGKHHEGP